MSDAKPISMPPHLWSALDQMAGEMGVPRDALVAQAVFTLARLNGYVLPGKAHVAAGGPPVLSAPVAAPAPAPAPVVGNKTGAPSRQPPMAMRRAPEPEPEPEPEEDDLPPEDDYPPESSQEEDPHEQDSIPEDDPLPDEEPEPEPPPRASNKVVLVASMPGHDSYRMTGDVMTIGRGKTCEFVIDSNRVSREHVRITREGADFWLEDLNSSNGTFFGPNKSKVTRQKIKDGDEFTFGTEKVKFQFKR